jgi:signal transduction histidine kinase
MLDAMVDGIVNDPETVKRYLKQSQNEVSQMSILIDDLFELAQLDAGYLDLDFQRISLSDLISDTLEGFSAKAKAKSISLQGSITDEVDPIWAAPDKISRILDNLVSNALRYTPTGGNIYIEAQLNDDRILIEVRDSGSGIAPKDLPYIFDRFYHSEKSRTRNDKDRSAGAGLGLAIVKSLIKAHGGEIWVQSEPGSGTKFWFTLPKHSITDI